MECAENDELACTRAVENHAHEELVVVKADAVGNPRAMMVHLENALVALEAMMASVWLGIVAPGANPRTTDSLRFERSLGTDGGQQRRVIALAP